MNIGLKSANGFKSGPVRWGEPDRHRSCRSPRSFRDQAENQTAALIRDLHKLGIIWYRLSN